MKNFEQHLRNRFDGREVQVDKNELWASIAPQLESPKQERKVWFFFLLGIATGATMLGLYFFTQEDKPTITAIATTEQQIAETISSSEQKQSSKQEFAAEAISSNNPAIDGTATRPLPASSETIKTNQRQKVSTNTAKSVDFSNNPDSDGTPSIQPEKTPTFFQASNNPAFAGAGTTVTTPAPATSTDAIIRLSEMVTAEIPSLAHRPFPTQMDYTTAVGTTSTLISPQKLKNRIGLGLYGGGSATQTIRKEPVESEFIYAQLRGSTEDPLPSIHLGLQAVFELHQNIYFQTGLEYSQLRSRLNLEDEKILLNPVTQEITRGIGITDTAVVIPDEAIVVEVQENKTLNRFHLVDLPVLAGYQFGHSRWRVGLEAGAFINLSLQKDGEILQQDVAVYDLKEDSDGWYKGNVGIRPHLGLVSTYNLTKHYQLYFSTGMTFNKVFTTGNSPLREEKSLFGVRMGGRYFF
jgi:Outer membrane protein beta-barrel domain